MGLIASLRNLLSSSKTKDIHSTSESSAFWARKADAEKIKQATDQSASVPSTNLTRTQELRLKIEARHNEVMQRQKQQKIDIENEVLQRQKQQERETKHKEWLEARIMRQHERREMGLNPYYDDYVGDIKKLPAHTIGGLPMDKKSADDWDTK